jgi:hypothetical protein
MIAFHVWSRTKPHINVESINSYELAKNPPVFSIPAQGKIANVPVIPDGLILLHNVRSNQRLVIIWEVDHNTESQPRFKAHVTARLAYVQSAAFKKVYGDIPLRIAYATFGHTPSAAEARRVSLWAFTREVLIQLKKTEYAKYFRFTTINFSTLYEDAQALFEMPVWYRPDDSSPVPLLADTP